ncbi:MULTISPECIES: glycosyl hydrolase family 8 [Thermodesulfovibrio]|uniref:glycosyl hydrolase family 8 n=1 Tax=Thermodesulfovibrio TaxID=28261 RepID=UPI00262B3324|nr:glycosyl hydrolase family 8 [Thermodesulfovibrio sp.]
MRLISKIVYIVMIFCICQAASAEVLSEYWSYYKRNFLSEDGRVIDIQSSSISHSEGQGYGMLLSVFFSDKETFDKLWRWTRDNLQVRNADSLFAWSWGKHFSGKWTVLDYNNASDGDTLIAYALCLAGDKWKRQEYIEEAMKIIEVIKNLLVLKIDSSYYVLPAYYGFYRENEIIINPSYYILPAYRVFQAVGKDDFWGKLYGDSVRLLKKLSFGKYGLPPDWIVLKGDTFNFYSERPITFGFEAIRIPLYALMAEESELIKKFKDYIEFIERIDFIPQDFDFKENRFSSHDGLAMHYLLFSFVAKKLGKERLHELLLQRGLKKLETEKNYYSFTISLLVLKAGIK